MGSYVDNHLIKDESVMGRILNYGSMTVIGSGGTRETFHKISRPLAFRKAFQELCGECNHPNKEPELSKLRMLPAYLKFKENQGI
jgi:hypothetical protein